MTLLIRIIIILSCDVLIFNLPASHGFQSNQGYHISTIRRVLTPDELSVYKSSGTLPDRIYYSNKKHCYVVRRQKGHYENSIRGQEGKSYKAIPRWEYYLDKLSPISLIKSGLEFVSSRKPLVSGVGFDYFSDGDNDVDGGTDDDVDIGTDNPANDATDDVADDATDDTADDADNNEKDPGLLSKGVDMGMGLMSPLFNLFGGSKDANKKNNNENKDDNDDKKDENKDDDNDKKDEKKDDDKDNEEGDKPADSESYMDMAKDVMESDAVEMAQDVLQSDTAKEVVKTGISMFVPGGPAIVAAMEAVQKYQKADAAIDKVEDKLPHLK